jgi:IMP dehydrogenase
MEAVRIQAKDPELLVRDVMQTQVITLSPDQPLREAMHVLAAHDISGAPVCNSLGRVEGIFSKTDAIEVCLLGGWDQTVRDVMMPMVFSIAPGEPMQAAVELMAFEGVHRLIVLNEKGELKGIITPMDVLQHLAHVERGSIAPRSP